MTHNDEFALRKDIMYLNHAAVAPWPQRTVLAVKKFAEENAAQGSKDYPRWLTVEAGLRGQLQQLINAPSSDDIALLKNTSEALSVVAFGLPWQTGDNIVSSNEEFPSNRVVWEALREQGVELRQADLQSADTPEDALFARVDARTRLMTVSSIQYASGLRLNLEKLGRFCREHDILFCIDAIQSIGAMRFDVQAAHADFVMADGHKWMLGPEGLALFYCRAALRDQLRLHQFGWHMTDAFVNYDRHAWQPAPSARRFECGSPNMLGIHALSASVSLLLEAGMERVEGAVLDHARTLHDTIVASHNLELLSNSTPGRFGGIITFRHRTVDNQRVFERLTQHGVICAMRGGGVRFSPHFYTPMEQLLRAVELATSM